MTTTALLSAFSTHLLAAGRGAGTVRLRIGYLERLAHDHPDLLAVTSADLEAYLAERRLTLKAETRKSMRASFRAFYAWACTQGHLDVDPAAQLEAVRTPRTVPRIAPDSDVQRALESASPSERAILLLGRLGCLRRAEIASLHTSHRDRDTLRVTGKGEKQRLVYLNAQLLDALVALEAEQGAGFYFPGHVDGHVHVTTIYRVVRSLAGWNTHSLRHAGATAAFRSTRDLRAVQEMLGHASLSTTERYVHTDEDAMRAAARGTSFGSVA